jgi:hypothetical protein
MGTPHRGADIASWALLFSNVVNTVSLGRAIRKDLLRDLEPKSSMLMETERQFVQRSVPLKIISFTEQLIQTPLTSRVSLYYFQFGTERFRSHLGSLC